MNIEKKKVCARFAVDVLFWGLIILIALLLVCIILILGRALIAEIIEYFKERKRLREEAMNKAFDDNSPYVVPQETSSQVFTIEDIQEQNRKKRVTMVDAVPPEGPVDLSFYGEPPNVRRHRSRASSTSSSDATSRHPLHLRTRRSS